MNEGERQKQVKCFSVHTGKWSDGPPADEVPEGYDRLLVIPYAQMVEEMNDTLRRLQAAGHPQTVAGAIAVLNLGAYLLHEFYGVGADMIAKQTHFYCGCLDREAEGVSIVDET